MTEDVATTDTAALSDTTLTAAVRAGDTSAYATLYARHFHAARRLAAALGITGMERDDLVAESFTRVLRALRTGGGPGADFRPYLLVTVRNTLIDWRRRDRAITLVPDVPDVLPTAGHEDAVCTRADASMAARAFASLPERWRSVLWRTEIEDQPPSRIAESLGMTPNGVAALAYRAREGLRQAYLSQHVPDTDRATCKAVARLLPDWVRHGGTAHRTHRITTHLGRCAHCRDLETSLRTLNQELPSLLALVLTAPTVLADCASAVPGATTALWITAAKALALGTVVLVAAPACLPRAAADIRTAVTRYLAGQ